MRHADDLLRSISVSNVEEAAVEASVGNDQISGFFARFLGLELGATRRTIPVLAVTAFEVRRVLPFVRRHESSLFGYLLRGAIFL